MACKSSHRTRWPSPAAQHGRRPTRLVHGGVVHDALGAARKAQRAANRNGVGEAVRPQNPAFCSNRPATGTHQHTRQTLSKPHPRPAPVRLLHVRHRGRAGAEDGCLGVAAQAGLQDARQRRVAVWDVPAWAEGREREGRTAGNAASAVCSAACSAIAPAASSSIAPGPSTLHPWRPAGAHRQPPQGAPAPAACTPSLSLLITVPRVSSDLLMAAPCAGGAGRRQVGAGAVMSRAAGGMLGATAAPQPLEANAQQLHPPQQAPALHASAPPLHPSHRPPPSCAAPLLPSWQCAHCPPGPPGSAWTRGWRQSPAAGGGGSGRGRWVRAGKGAAQWCLPISLGCRLPTGVMASRAWHATHPTLPPQAPARRQGWRPGCATPPPCGRWCATGCCSCSSWSRQSGGAAPRSPPAPAPGGVRGQGRRA